MWLKQCPEKEVGNYKRVSFVSRKNYSKIIKRMCCENEFGNFKLVKMYNDIIRDKFKNVIKAVSWTRVWEF